MSFPSLTELLNATDYSYKAFEGGRKNEVDLANTIATRRRSEADTSRINEATTGLKNLNTQWENDAGTRANDRLKAEEEFNARPTLQQLKEQQDRKIAKEALDWKETQRKARIEKQISQDNQIMQQIKRSNAVGAPIAVGMLQNFPDAEGRWGSFFKAYDIATNKPAFINNYLKAVVKQQEDVIKHQVKLENTAAMKQKEQERQEQRQLAAEQQRLIQKRQEQVKQQRDIYDNGSLVIGKDGRPDRQSTLIKDINLFKNGELSGSALVQSAENYLTEYELKQLTEEGSLNKQFGNKGGSPSIQEKVKEQVIKAWEARYKPVAGENVNEKFEAIKNNSRRLQANRQKYKNWVETGRINNSVYTELGLQEKLNQELKEYPGLKNIPNFDDWGSNFVKKNLLTMLNNYEKMSKEEQLELDQKEIKALYDYAKKDYKPPVEPADSSTTNKAQNNVTPKEEPQNNVTPNEDDPTASGRSKWSSDSSLTQMSNDYLDPKVQTAVQKQLNKIALDAYERVEKALINPKERTPENTQIIVKKFDAVLSSFEGLDSEGKELQAQIRALPDASRNTFTWNNTKDLLSKLSEYVKKKIVDPVINTTKVHFNASDPNNLVATTFKGLNEHVFEGGAKNDVNRAMKSILTVAKETKEGIPSAVFTGSKALQTGKTIVTNFPTKVVDVGREESLKVLSIINKAVYEYNRDAILSGTYTELANSIKWLDKNTTSVINNIKGIITPEQKKMLLDRREKLKKNVQLFYTQINKVEDEIEKWGGKRVEEWKKLVEKYEDLQKHIKEAIEFKSTKGTIYNKG